MFKVNQGKSKVDSAKNKRIVLGYPARSTHGTGRIYTVFLAINL